MKRRAKLWSLIGLLFASFTMVIAGIGHLGGLGAVETSAAAVTGTINFGSASGKTRVDGASVSGNDSQSNRWTITTAGTTSFTQNADYSQIGSSSKPASSITITTTLAASQTITAFSAKFGGFSGTAGTVTLKVGDTTVGTGSLNETSDVTVSNSSSETGTVLTVTVTGISKGVKAYFVSYTYPRAEDSSEGSGGGSYAGEYKLTIETNHFNTTSYDANNNEKTTNAVCTSDPSKLYSVKWTSHQVMQHDSSMQWQKNAGYIYNSTNLGSISSVTITKTEGSYTTYYGDSEQPSSGTTTGKPFFKTSIGGAKGLSSKIEVVFVISGGGSSSEETSSEESSSDETSIAPAITIVSNVEGGSFEVGVGLTYDFIVTLTNATPDTYKIAASGAGTVSMATGATPIDGDTAIPSDTTVIVTGVTKGAVTLTCTSVADNTKSTVINVTVTKSFTPTGDAAGPYKLVKNVSEINSDCYVIIASGTTGSVSALGPQADNNNNRTAKSGNNVSDELITSLVKDVQVLRLEKDGDNWTLRENANDGGYLYAASSSSNYLRAQETNDGNGLWAITVDTTTGVASITAQGSNSHNVMQFNSGSSLFSCYASASQSDVYIFKAITVTPVSELTLEDGDGATIADESTVNVLTNATFKFKGSVNSSATIKGVTYSAKDSSNNPITLETEGDYKLLPAAKYAARGDYTVTVTSVGMTSGATMLSKSFTIHVEDQTITTFEFRNGVGTKITTASIYLGETLDITWAIDPDGLDHCSGYTAPTSNNTNAATVDLKSGRVWTITAVGYNQGPATISATVSCQGETLTASVVVTVLIHEVESITVTSDDTLDLNWNSESAIATTVLPANATIPTLTYTSSDEDVCTVSSTGVVHAIDNGTATITIAATDGSDVTATVTVNVTKIHVADFTLNYSSHKIYVASSDHTPKSWPITVKSWTTDPLGYDTPSDPRLLFESTNPSIAVVNDAGLVTAAGTSLGNVNINVTSVSDPEISKVFVAKIVADISYVGFSVSGFSMQKGDEADLSNPEEAPFKVYSYDGEIDDPETEPTELEWSSYSITSSNTNVAGFSSSVLQAHAAGRTTLTVTYAGKSATCQLVVAEAAPSVKSLSYTGTVDDCVFGDSDYLDYIGASDSFVVTATYDDDSVADVTVDSIYGWNGIVDGHLLAGPHEITAFYGDISINLPMRTTSVGAEQRTQTGETVEASHVKEYVGESGENNFSGWPDPGGTGVYKDDYVIKFDGEGDCLHNEDYWDEGAFVGADSVVVILDCKQNGTSGDNVLTVTLVDSEGENIPNGSANFKVDLGNSKTGTISRTITGFSNAAEIAGLKIEMTTKIFGTNVGLKSVHATRHIPGGVPIYEENFTFAEQANSFASYIGRFNSCDYASFVARDPDTVQQLALEWNSMAAGSKTLAHGMTIKDYNYNEGEYDYGTDSKIDDVNVWYKLKTIVSLYNIANPESKIYLCETGDPVNRTDASSGGVAPMTPYAAKFMPVNQSESSPLTTTLWIVLASGMTGLAAIGAAYFISKKKRERA